MAVLILAIILIIVFDGLVSAAEAAILSLPLYKARVLAKKSQLGKLLLSLKEASEQPITTLISLSNLITIVGSVLTGAIAVNFFGEAWLWLFAALLTFLIMIFAEIIPKKIGEQYAEVIAMAMAPIIFLLSKAFFPITFVIQRIIRPLLRRKKQLTSEEEIAYLAEIGGREGAIEEYESRLIQKVFRLNDITAADMMTPKPFIFMLDGNHTLGEAAEDIKNSRHSRIPLYDKSPNKIIGIVHQKDLLKALVAGKYGAQLKEFAQEPLVVPEGRLGDELLKDFQESKKQLGIVVDDRSNVVGVVGIEDVLEELVGEIVEEKDVAPELIKRISKNEILVHGHTQISYLNHFFNIELPNHRTINGSLLDHFGHLPKTGEFMEIQNLKFIIEETTRSAIERVRIIKAE